MLELPLYQYVCTPSPALRHVYPRLRRTGPHPTTSEMVHREDALVLVTTSGDRCNNTRDLSPLPRVHVHVHVRLHLPSAKCERRLQGAW